MIPEFLFIHRIEDKTFKSFHDLGTGAFSQVLPLTTNYILILGLDLSISNGETDVFILTVVNWDGEAKFRDIIRRQDVIKLIPLSSSSQFFSRGSVYPNLKNDGGFLLTIGYSGRNSK